MTGRDAGELGRTWHRHLNEIVAEKDAALAAALGRIEVLLSDSDAVWFSDRETAHLRVLAALRVARGDD